MFTLDLGRPLPGDRVERSIGDMIQIAHTLHVNTKATFNGIELRARPYSKSEDVLEQYNLGRAEQSKKDAEPSAAKQAEERRWQEPDWTCPNCGYDNLAVRTKCRNYHLCGYLRPLNKSDNEPSMAAAVLRSCAQTIAENRMHWVEASEYLSKYAITTEKQQGWRVSEPSSETSSTKKQNLDKLAGSAASAGPVGRELKLSREGYPKVGPDGSGRFGVWFGPGYAAASFDTKEEAVAWIRARWDLGKLLDSWKEEQAKSPALACPNTQDVGDNCPYCGFPWNQHRPHPENWKKGS